MEPFSLRQTIRKQQCLICHQEFELADDVKYCPNDGSFLSPVFDDPFINSTIDEKYQIIERIASGGTSRIYKARHLTLDRYVALKVLQGGQEITEAQLGRFQKEAQVAIGLVHPHIVRVFDYGTDPQPYIVMEHIEGRTFAAFIKAEGALPAKRALPIFIQICEAMSVAHAASLVHRDIKPSNVIIEEKTGTAKVLDFGLVKDFVDDAKYTRTGETVGSPAYMSPEQWKGLELDARSDIYSLGFVMYEVLTSKALFAGDNPVECMFKHLESPAPQLSKVRRDLKFPQGLNKVVSNCLIKDPKYRYQSMDELKQDLEYVQSGLARKVISRQIKKKSHSIMRSISLMFLLLLLTAVSFIAYRDQTIPHWQKLADEGINLQLQDAPDWSASIPLLLQAKVEAEAANAPRADIEMIYGHLGQGYLLTDKPQEAGHYLEHALKMNLEHTEDVPRSHWHERLSGAYCELDEGEKALQHAQIALKIAQKLSTNQERLYSCWYDLGRAYWVLGKYKEAIKSFIQARGIAVRSYGEDCSFLTWINWYLGDSYFCLRRNKEAFDAYGQTLKLAYQLKSGDLSYYMGAFSSHLQHRNDIKVDELAVQQQWPISLTALIKGAVLQQQQKYDKAIAEFDKALDEMKDSPLIYIWKASCYQYGGKFAEAVTNYRHAVGLYNNRTFAVQSGSPVPAVRNKKHEPIFNTIESVYIQTATCLSQLKRYDEALVELGNAIHTNPENQHLHFQRGLLLFESGKFRLAVQGFLKFLKSGKQNCHYHPYAVILTNLAYRFANNNIAAQDVISKFSDKTIATKEWPCPIIKYLDNTITADELQKIAQHDKDKLTEAKAYIGIDLLAKGKKLEARKYLTWVIEHGRKDFVEYEISNILLKKAQK